jgi:hypothetical protein
MCTKLAGTFTSGWKNDLNQGQRLRHLIKLHFVLSKNLKNGFHLMGVYYQCKNDVFFNKILNFYSTFFEY